MGNPPILEADDLLGACYRKAMAPKKLWTLLFLQVAASFSKTCLSNSPKIPAMLHSKTPRLAKPLNHCKSLSSPSGRNLEVACERHLMECPRDPYGSGVSKKCSESAKRVSWTLSRHLVDTLRSPGPERAPETPVLSGTLSSPDT